MFLLSINPLFPGFMTTSENWISEKQNGYVLHYTAVDKPNKEEYQVLINKGTETVSRFFHGTYKNDFNIFIHPDRQSLDSTWRKEWNMPEFKSECWMVASGVAARLDIISPVTWADQSCEHKYADLVKTQQLITHELVHVYHGQFNPSGDFSDVTGIDWFVEGLATYASGQCDSARMSTVKKAIAANQVPQSLDAFWTGPLKYGLSGSMVMFIDKQNGREKLTGLLGFNRLTELLSALNTTEAELINGWRKYMQE